LKGSGGVGDHTGNYIEGALSYFLRISLIRALFGYSENFFLKDLDFGRSLFML